MGTHMPVGPLQQQCQLTKMDGERAKVKMQIGGGKPAKNGKKTEDGGDEGGDVKLRSQVDQLYYLLRAESAYKEEANDKDMAARVS